jgi:hypothetical protein
VSPKDSTDDRLTRARTLSSCSRSVSLQHAIADDTAHAVQFESVSSRKEMLYRSPRQLPTLVPLTMSSGGQ